MQIFPYVQLNLDADGFKSYIARKESPPSDGETSQAPSDLFEADAQRKGSSTLEAIVTAELRGWVDANTLAVDVRVYYRSEICPLCREGMFHRLWKHRTVPALPPSIHSGANGADLVLVLTSECWACSHCAYILDALIDLKFVEAALRRHAVQLLADKGTYSNIFLIPSYSQCPFCNESDSKLHREGTVWSEPRRVNLEALALSDDRAILQQRFGCSNGHTVLLSSTQRSQEQIYPVQYTFVAVQASERPQIHADMLTPPTCPHPECRILMKAHRWYQRTPHTDSGPIAVYCRVYRCPACGRTMVTPLDGIRKHAHYSEVLLQKTTQTYLETLSYQSTAETARIFTDNVVPPSESTVRRAFLREGYNKRLNSPKSSDIDVEIIGTDETFLKQVPNHVETRDLTYSPSPSSVPSDSELILSPSPSTNPLLPGPSPVLNSERIQPGSKKGKSTKGKSTKGKSTKKRLQIAFVFCINMLTLHIGFCTAMGSYNELTARAYFEKLLDRYPNLRLLITDRSTTTLSVLPVLLAQRQARGLSILRIQYCSFHILKNLAEKGQKLLGLTRDKNPYVQLFKRIYDHDHLTCAHQAINLLQQGLEQLRKDDQTVQERQLHIYAQDILTTCQGHLFTYLDLGLRTKSNSAAEMIAWLIKRFHCPRGHVTRCVICARNWAANFRAQYNQKRRSSSQTQIPPLPLAVSSSVLTTRPQWELLALRQCLQALDLSQPVDVRV